MLLKFIYDLPFEITKLFFLIDVLLLLMTRFFKSALTGMSVLVGTGMNTNKALEI